MNVRGNPRPFPSNRVTVFDSRVLEREFISKKVDLMFNLKKRNLIKEFTNIYFGGCRRCDRLNVHLHHLGSMVVSVVISIGFAHVQVSVSGSSQCVIKFKEVPSNHPSGFQFEHCHTSSYHWSSGEVVVVVVGTSHQITP